MEILDSRNTTEFHSGREAEACLLGLGAKRIKLPNYQARNVV